MVCYGIFWSGQLVALEVLVSVCFCAQEPVGVPLVELLLRSLPNLVPSMGTTL